MQYYLGVDIGTTATKVVAFSTTGDVLANTTSYYGMYHPQPGWSEQDPDEILQAVITAINNMLSVYAPQPPVFISFGAAMHSILAVNEQGQPLIPAIIWADNRAAGMADALRQSEQGVSFYQTTGVPVHSMSPLCKLLWLKQHESAIFASSFKFIGIKEYVFFHCFGKYMVDTSIASATGLLNLESLQWDQSILQFIGINPERLSAVVSTKQVLYYQGAHPKLSLPLQTPIVIGGSDGALSNLGAMGKDWQALVVNIGTSGAVRRIVHHPRTDRQMRTFCYHVKDSDYIIGGATNNGGVVMQWLKDTLLQSGESFEELFDLAGSVAPGSEGLVFIPYILGERAPIWNAHAKGVFFGLNVRHGKAHLVRAAMESVIFCLYSIGSILFEEDNARELFASGGFARSPLWLQMLADVFNKEVYVSATVDSAALGAVKLGAEALGIAFNEGNKIEMIYKPNPESHGVYYKSFEQFQRLYALLASEMK